MLRNIIKRNTELFFGILLIISQATIWFVPAYVLGRKSVEDYYFISIFPNWFVLSAFGSIGTVVLLMIIFCLCNK